MIQKKEALLCFVGGFGLFTFTLMSRLVPTIPVTILIAPVFILRFIRLQPRRQGNLLTLAGFLMAINIAFLGLFELGGSVASLLFNLVRSSLLALLYFLPYSIDRALYPRLKDRGALATLIFPVATTAVLYLLTLEGPFEGSYQMGKFLFGPVAFKQVISLTGLPGAVFLTSWFASVVNYIRERGLIWRRVQGIVVPYALITAAVLTFGLVKTVPAPPASEKTVRTASIVLIPDDGEAVELIPLLETRTTHDIDSRLEWFKEKMRLAVAGGAKIVMSHELAFLIDEADRDYFSERCRSLADEYDVYLAMNYGYYVEDGKGENLVLLIDDRGEVLMEYAKRYLLGLGEIGETLVFRKGPEKLQYADTPYGRISVSVCREINMAKYMIQAGRNGVDIMISPAYEWPENLTINSGYMRGIENGFSVVRASYNGITYASDYDGRILATMPFSPDETGVMFADLPVEGVRTFYPNIGPLFAWFCIAVLAGFSGTALVIGHREKSVKS